ncbi:hypothetical protein H2198_008119 [Neophaeococcomyces mojaviensis]|uniref:Uncharacterized protein n=1 Tax=Neophaeococcomyces mojaviensis TaxID=3383035 RepID=A0ACC2ZYH2_9EURO|nr:hypothetical protein H2198_008119 [Knufia sp. JES_112]
MAAPTTIGGADKGLSEHPAKSSLDAASLSTSDLPVNTSSLSDVIPPHESYEGYSHWDPTLTWTVEEENRVLRKTDFWLLSVICLMFFGLQLDRGNLSNALTDNFLKDMGGLSTNAYNNGTTIQLVCFLAAEFPVQLLTKRYGFRKVLPIMMMAWSTVSWAQAFIHNRTGFYLTRALIGACEGGFIPGTILFATYFYKSRELGSRLAVFWSTLNIARVISALLAAALLQMRGVGGKPGWFWLFLLEGLLTFLIGLFAFFYLPQSPVATKSVICRKPWFTAREEQIMINRLLRDDPAKGLTAIKEPATWSDIKGAWSDKSMWGLYFIGLIAYIPATPVQAYLSYSLKVVGGFTTFQSNMLTVVSAVVQVITILALAKSSEIFNERTWHCFFGELWVFPCLVALLTLPDTRMPWQRFSIATLVSGYPYFHPILSAWISENSFSVKKRALTAATYNVIVQVGSLIGSQIYRADDAPYYHRGNKVLISFCVVALVALVAQSQWLKVLNKRKEQVWNKMTEAEKAQYQADTKARELDGNKRLDFRFKR